MSTSSHARALPWMFAAMVCSGVGFVIGKASLLMQAPLVAGESSWFIAAQNLAPRFLITAAVLVGMGGRATLRLTDGEWKQAVFMAFFSFLGCALQVDAMQYTSASTAAFLSQFYAILLPVWVAIGERKAPSRLAVAAMILVVIGTAVLAGVRWDHFQLGRGEAETLLAALSFSVLIYSLSWRRHAAHRAEATTAGMFVLEGAMFVALAVFTVKDAGHLVAPLASPGWLLVISLATVIATGGPFVVLNRWQRHLPATEAGLLYNLVPLFAALSELVLPRFFSAWFEIDYANTSVTQRLLVGGALIVGANAVLQYRSARRQPLRGAASATSGA